MAIGEVLVKTFSNGTKVFSKEVLKNGVRATRTTAFDSTGHLICDRFKTLSSQNIVSGKMNIGTKQYFGEKALGEAFTQGKYSVTGRIYGDKGIKEVIKLNTTPTYAEKYGYWHGHITQPIGKQFNPLEDFNTFFNYNKISGKFSDIKQAYGVNELPTVASIGSEEKSLIKMLTEKLNLMKINENYRGR